MKYDFKKAKKLIEEAAKTGDLVKASLGMEEDWYWTAQSVWDKEVGFLEELDNTKTIAGIDGSNWATPTLRLEYQNRASEDITVGGSDAKPFKA